LHLFYPWQIVCAFSYRFWPADLFDVVCTHTFVPEIWFTSYLPSPPAVSTPPEKDPSPAKTLGNVVAVGFVAGDQAAEIGRLPEKEVFERFLAQLDSMFSAPDRGLGADVSSSGGDVSTSGEPARSAHELKLKVLESCFFEAVGVADVSPDVHPATAAFSGGHIENWADEPFIRGAYSHPSVGGHLARGALAQPLLGRLFFAGEATHPGVNPCLQAALDTGSRAALQISASQRPVKSRL
jgi:monoamine oxidase